MYTIQHKVQLQTQLSIIYNLELVQQQQKIVLGLLIDPQNYFMSTPAIPLPQPAPQIQKAPQSTLSTKNLFTHFFLIHDFLLHMVKSSSSNTQFFDLQIGVNDSMKKAANVGGKAGQIAMFTSLFFYCMKGRTIKLKLLYGFLYMYWIDHFYTFGAYTGILLKMPGIYSKVADYYLNYEPLNSDNTFLLLNNEMATNLDYENTQEILSRIFKEAKAEQKTYIVNEFFAKNKDKYFNQEEGTLVQRPTIKLKYLDCFLTRYVYYTFTRWYAKKLNSFGLGTPDF